MHWDIMCLVSNERRENALDNEAYNMCGNEDILTDKTGFLFVGTHCISMYSQPFIIWFIWLLEYLIEYQF